jgi:hypothetical protein
MDMEKFINQKKPNSPIVTILKYGKISFNKIACRQFNIKKHRFVEFYFDRGTREIGIKLTNDNNELDIFSIHQRRGKTPVIYCQSFLDHYGIPYRDGSKIFPAVWDEKRGMIIVRLD